MAEESSPWSPDAAVVHTYHGVMRRWGPLIAVMVAGVALLCVGVFVVTSTIDGHNSTLGSPPLSTSTTSPSVTTQPPTSVPTTQPTPSTVPTTMAPTTTIAAPVPTTTVAAATTSNNAGSLPQTPALPSSQDPVFVAKMTAVVESIRTGNCATSLSSFFPLAAFLQVKAEYGAASDWQYRLVGHYCRDVANLHASLGATASSMRFVSVNVPSWGVQWMAPGSEYNKGPYWHALGTTLTFVASGVAHTVPVMMLDSWRGQWYLVHLSTFT